MDERSIEQALDDLVATADALPGAYFAMISVKYKAGFDGPRWECIVEADQKGDDGDLFAVEGWSAPEAIRLGIAEAWKRQGMPPPRPASS